METRMSRNFDGPQPADVYAIDALYGNAFPLDEIFDDMSSDQESINANIDDGADETHSDTDNCDAGACGVGCSVPMMVRAGFVGNRRRHSPVLRHPHHPSEKVELSRVALPAESQSEYPQAGPIALVD